MKLSDRIKQTPTFEKLDNVQQSIYRKSEVRKQVQFALKMIELNDYDFWVKNTSPGITIRRIVKDLVDTPKASHLY